MNQSDPMELYIGICDDDAHMLGVLEAETHESLAKDYTPVIYTAHSGKELLSQNIPYHIVVLDVQMEDMDGVELARELISRNQNCQIIFVSGFPNSISYVYMVPHSGLIMKNQLKEYLPVFLKQSADLVAAASNEFVTIQIGKHSVVTKLSDITFLERNGHWTVVNLMDGKSLKTREKLTDLISRIHSTGFSQCHTSYAVNLLHIQAPEGSIVHMNNGEEIPISRKFRESFKTDFYSYLSLIPVSASPLSRTRS